MKKAVPFLIGLLGDFMEKPCQECKVVTMIDDESKLCYDCWCELDILDHDQNEHVRD